jgi:hypothetical protein
MMRCYHEALLVLVEGQRSFAAFLDVLHIGEMPVVLIGDPLWLQCKDSSSLRSINQQYYRVE